MGVVRAHKRHLHETLTTSACLKEDAFESPFGSNVN